MQAEVCSGRGDVPVIQISLATGNCRFVALGRGFALLLLLLLDVFAPQIVEGIAEDESCREERGDEEEECY